MMEKPISRVLCLILWLALFPGCLQNSCPSTSSYNGGLCIRITQAEQKSLVSKALASDIRQIAAIIALDKADLTIKTDPVPYTGSGQELKINDIYPGKWHVVVNCYAADQSIIFAGKGDVTISSGVTATLQLDIKPAPGNLNVILDATGISGFGPDLTGKIYVYTNSQGSASEIGILKANGKYLKGSVAIAEGTVQVRVAVPQVSDSNVLFVSPYYTLDIHTGQTATLNIAPDGSISISGVINSTPATPLNFTAAYLDKTNGKVLLQWSPVVDSDLKGYYIYRSNGDGKMARLIEIANNIVSYTDSVSASNFYNGRINYTVSSFDEGGNESFWSNVATIDK